MRIISTVVIVGVLATTHANSTTDQNSHYIVNRWPLGGTAYVHLPLGAVTPEGWLKKQLQVQADGLSGYVYSGFEASYWSITNYHEGLVALAYVLDEPRLSEQVYGFVDEMLARRTDSRIDNHHVHHGLRFMTEYYEASEDERVIEWMDDYFEENAESEASTAFQYCCNQNRAGENLLPAYWLYNRTRDTAMLAAVGRNFRANTDAITEVFRTFPDLCADFHYHGVDLAQQIKFPGAYYQQFPDEDYREAVFEGIERMDRRFGQVGGRFAAHEKLPEPYSRGLWPTNGTELCAVIEYAYSLERLFEIFGEVSLADRLELLVYNAIPGAMTPDMWAHQYDQQANQVEVSDAPRDWDNSSTANMYGLTPHYPCCLSNMHHGWPRFVEYMWMATHDNGLAAVAYGPSRVRARVGEEGRKVTIVEETDYPFDGTIRFEISQAEPTAFPLHLRIPAWAGGASYTVGGVRTVVEAGDTMVVVDRTWEAEDELVLDIPLVVRTERRHNDALAVMRGPLYFSLRIGQEYVATDGPRGIYPSYDYEIRPTTSWNYALVVDGDEPASLFQVVTNPVGDVPFAQRGEPLYRKNAPDPSPSWEQIIWDEDEPVILKAKGCLLPDWGMRDNSADTTPSSPAQSASSPVDIELIPYGCTRLRISEFPWFDPLTRTGTAVAAKTGPNAFGLRVANAGRKGAHARIMYAVPRSAAKSAVRVQLHDLRGRLVHTLVEGPVDAGYHSVDLDGGTLPAGHYLCRMSAAGFEKSVTVSLVR